MPYSLIDRETNGYALISGEPFVNFNAGQVFLDILKTYHPNLEYTSEIVSMVKGNGNMVQTLFKFTLNADPKNFFYVYCFQTEGNGRWNLIKRGEDEARIQWRKHKNWEPDLDKFAKANEFSQEIKKQPNDLTNKECYIFSFYKRDAEDTDIVISAVYPTQAKDVELHSESNKGISFSYEKIQEAFINGYSQYPKTNGEFIFNFKPEYLISYMINRDKLHKQALQGILKPSGSIMKRTEYPYNLIYFGAPGAGKSHKIDGYVDDDNSIKITFHPDTDYATFVGSYKPFPVAGGTSITYGFAEQAFLKAYIKAWETDQDTFLIIEEINRGNCAQIFGDVFQIIERAETGYSRYPVDINSEIELYLKKHFEDLEKGDAAAKAKAVRYKNHFKGVFNKISLPDNLFIHASMNTSDQSLFPIDSAFKRRWDWEYVPIKFDGTEADKYQILINSKKYSWRKFIEKINFKIQTITESEDKLLGQFFIKSFDNLITEESFKSKVLFYIWNDVLKDESQTEENYFFRTKPSEELGSKSFTFNDLFLSSSTDTLENFMKYLDIEITSVIEVLPNKDEETPTETSEVSSTEAEVTLTENSEVSLTEEIQTENSEVSSAEAEDLPKTDTGD